MSVTTNTTVVHRLDLGIAMREFAEQQGYIGAKLFPVIPVDRKAASFRTVKRESLLRKLGSEELLRAAKSDYKRRDTALGTIQYECVEYGVEEPIDDAQQAELASEFDYERVVAQTLTQDLLRAHEARVAAALINTGTFTGADLTTDISGSAPFATASSNVIGALQTAATRVQRNCGAPQKDLTLAIDQVNFNRLKQNDDIREGIIYTREMKDADVGAALADLIGIKQVLVGDVVQNDANEGQAFDGQYLWGSTYAFLGLVSEGSFTAGNDVVSLPGIGRTTLFTADSPSIITVERYRNDAIRSDVLRVRHTVDELLMDPKYGHLLKVA